MGRRTERTERLIQREISALLERALNDPRLCGLISVTGVRLSPDFRYAKVFVSTLSDEAGKKDVLAALTTASGFLRRELASRLRLRSIPQLDFHYDDSIERGTRLLTLIGQVSDSEHT